MKWTSSAKNNPSAVQLAPPMLAVAVDGNRKHHRFKKSGSLDETGYFEGVFLCNDEHVSAFVDDIRKKVHHAPGKGVCGAAEFAAAKESSRKASSKLDEEGIELAVCRHGVFYGHSISNPM
ncbi:hypothetical protein NQZ68_027050 [Dissostichus eleginoides]|nr:hypothetical protein NQZ68_027050 [Dissostichus eleginoides]